MKPIALALAAILCAAAGGYWLGANRHAAAPADSGSAEQNARKVLYWYDPMRPDARFDKPGKSPFMDMDLVPRYADEAQQNEGVKIDPRQQQNLGIRTAAVSRKNIAFTLNAYAAVAVDERAITTIPAPANGVVEKLWVSAPQQSVRKNEPLARLWLPQWATAQQEYLAISRLGDASLTSAARARLQLQFMPEETIRAVERTGKPQTRLTLRAPHAGYISELAVRAGAQVNASQPLLELAAAESVWLVVDYPQSQAGLLAVGSRVTATAASRPGEIFQGAVDELLPELDVATRTLKARVTIKDPARRLKPGMYLNVRLAQPADVEVLAIPEEAPIAIGSLNRVVIAEPDGYFQTREVTLGRAQNGWVEILSGLNEGDRVVTSGQFLIDSEASLRSALPQSGKEPEAWTARGIIKAMSENSLTLAHEAIPALNWPAMTMDFAISPQQREPLAVNDEVTFTFALDENGARIISIMPIRAATAAGHKEGL